MSSEIDFDKFGNYLRGCGLPVTSAQLESGLIEVIGVYMKEGDTSYMFPVSKTTAGNQNIWPLIARQLRYKLNSAKRNTPAQRRLKIEMLGRIRQTLNDTLRDGVASGIDTDDEFLTPIREFRHGIEQELRDFLEKDLDTPAS